MNVLPLGIQPREKTSFKKQRQKQAPLELLPPFDNNQAVHETECEWGSNEIAHKGVKKRKSQRSVRGAAKGKGLNAGKR